MKTASLEAPPAPRSPWQLLYGAAHRARRAWQRTRARRLPRPVISVGNLHWGGAGKTPLVAAIAVHLRDHGLRVAILARGYRRRGREIRVVSLGEGPLLGPLVAGDEPVLLAGDLPGVGVVVGPDRFRAGLHSLERLEPPPQVFLLDDGFSHLRLARDLDLLAFPAADPFGGGRLAPGGRLREPLASAADAHAAILTGAGAQGDGEALARALAAFGFRGSGFASRTAALPPRTADGRTLESGTRVLLVTGVARPASVAALAEGAGLEITGSLTFGDHHRYPAASLAEIERAFRDVRAACVLATAKDRVKLEGRLSVPLAELPIRAEPEPAFWGWLDARLPSLLGDGDGR